jgi:hypothetical protein
MLARKIVLVLSHECVITGTVKKRLTLSHVDKGPSRFTVENDAAWATRCYLMLNLNLIERLDRCVTLAERKNIRLPRVHPVQHELE